jgi:hypothetical protein
MALALTSDLQRVEWAHSQEKNPVFSFVSSDDLSVLEIGNHVERLLVMGRLTNAQLWRLYPARNKKALIMYRQAGKWLKALDVGRYASDLPMRHIMTTKNKFPLKKRGVTWERSNVISHLLSHEPLKEKQK